MAGIPGAGFSVKLEFLRNPPVNSFMEAKLGG
jgi:hypothetical protein